MPWRAAAMSPPSPRALPIQQQQQEEEAAALSISDQRTLYLVNIFIGNTARFLNSFSSICEEKLSQLHRRILRLDATLTLLEAKLGSTCHYEGFVDNSCLEAKGSSSQPSPQNTLSNDRSLDPPCGSGESSRGAANAQKTAAVTIMPSERSHGSLQQSNNPKLGEDIPRQGWIKDGRK